MSTRKAASLAPAFAALGDDTRLELIGKLLRQSPQSISDLAANSKLTRQAVTKHLQVLEGASLVSSARTGRLTLYTFESKTLNEMTAYLNRASALSNGFALARFKMFVE